jgi:hypothetical protein
VKFVLAAGLFALSLAAQEKPAPDPSALRDVRHHFDLAATRAAANFHSLDSIEANLREDGAVLHPQLAALRLRIETALREAGAAIGERDLAAADQAIDRAQALLDRFARQIGGY